MHDRGSLETMHIVNCRLRSDGALPIASVLRASKTLTELDLSANAIGDVSDAVNQLITTNLLGGMSKSAPHALQSSNAFRTRFCYIEATSMVLEANHASLKALPARRRRRR